MLTNGRESISCFTVSDLIRELSRFRDDTPVGCGFGVGVRLTVTEDEDLCEFEIDLCENNDEEMEGTTSWQEEF